MKIGLIGYGKMGKEVERLAQERGWTVSIRLTSRSAPPSAKDLTEAEVGIHFANAGAVIESVTQWTKFRKPLVIGTTGWATSLGKVQRIVDQAGVGLVYGANFSPGVHLFTRLVSHAGKLADKFPDYDIALHESHHREKSDSPSGTALQLGNILLERIARKSELLTTLSKERIKPEQLLVTSSRVGTVVGTHSVLLDSQADSLELIHRAKSRAGFALGALLAAEWIKTRTGVHTVEEMMTDLLDT